MFIDIKEIVIDNTGIQEKAQTTVYTALDEFLLLFYFLSLY